MRGDRLPHRRECFHKTKQPFEFLPLAILYVIVMIEILPTPGDIFADHLYSACGRRIYAYILPGGWNDEFLDPQQVSTRQPLAIRSTVTKTSLWRATSTNAVRAELVDAGHERRPEVNS